MINDPQSGESAVPSEADAERGSLRAVTRQPIGSSLVSATAALTTTVPRCVLPPG